MFSIRYVLPVFLVWALVAAETHAYPVDGYGQTGIRRLARLEKLAAGAQKQKAKLPSGAWHALADIQLSLQNRTDVPTRELPPADAALQKEISGLFAGRDKSYSLALLDITPGRPARAAYYRSNRRYPVGSVGKLAVAAGLFAELRRLYPDDTGKRRELLKSRIVKAGAWIQSDHHKVPVYNPETGAYRFRKIQEGDAFSLYEWADHMLSVSANAAASTLWKELILMRKLGSGYPSAIPADETAFFKSMKRSELTRIAMAVVNDPLQAIGLTRTDFHQGSLFTRYGKQHVPGTGDSRATPEGLLRFLIALEQGRVVDAWSSLELKRLLYLTARRIRYASAPALYPAMVYFKSGSLYKCRPEPDFKCRKYCGNVLNAMNSVAIVEQPDGRRYLVALMSNVLKKNSAVEHQSLGIFIDRIIGRTAVPESP